MSKGSEQQDVNMNLICTVCTYIRYKLLVSTSTKIKVNNVPNYLPSITEKKILSYAEDRPV